MLLSQNGKHMGIGVIVIFIFMLTLDLVTYREIARTMEVSKIPAVLNEHILIGWLQIGSDWQRYIEHRKSSIRSKVEHVFRIIKYQFGYKKVVYRGLQKNENRLYALFACANLYSLAIADRKLSTT